MKKVLKKIIGKDMGRIIFVPSCAMFLTTPTVEELKQFELPELVDMLAKHTTEYVQLYRDQGVTSHTISLREMIDNIQVVIEYKKSEKPSGDDQQK